MLRSLPDLRGLDVVAAKSRLAAINVNAVVNHRSGGPRRIVREQLPGPGTDVTDDGDCQVLLLTFADPREAAAATGAHDR